MKSCKKFAYFLILVFLIGISNFNLCKAAEIIDKNNIKGFVKVAGSAALKEDGTIWTIPEFDNKKYQKVGEGFVDVDTDYEGIAYTALKKDGTLWVWGENNMGQFAKKVIAKSDVPVKIMDDVKAISGLAALKKDGSVWIWGGNAYYNASSKVNAPKMIYKGAKSVSYGPDYIRVIDSKGTLYAIANVNSGMGAALKFKKAKVSENVRFVNKNFYIKADKTLWSFIIADKIQAEPVLKNVIYADSNYVSSCAIKEDGTLWVWGFSDDNIPDSIKGCKNNPMKVLSGVKNARCGYQSVIAIKNDGSLCALGAICPKSNYSVLKTVMENVKKVYNNGWVLKEDNSLWAIEYIFDGVRKSKISDNVKNVSDDSIIERTDGTKWLYYSNYITGDYNLKELKNQIITSYHDLVLNADGSLSFMETDMNTGELSYKKVIQDFGEIKRFYSNNHFIYVIRKDNSLWAALKQVDSMYSPEIVKEYKTPVKILEDVKEITLTGSYGFAITYKGDLTAWKIDPIYPSNNYVAPKKVMEDVDCFDSQKYYSNYIIKKDKSLWYFKSIDFDWDDAKDKFTEVLSKSAVKDIENIDEIMTYNPQMYIKKNGELWVRGFGVKNTDNPGNEESSRFNKVMDNVKYADCNSSYGLSICKDGSLWEFGKLYNISGEMKIDAVTPRMLLKNVKEAQTGITCSALLEDGSFYIWGTNESGQLGTDDTEFSDKPQKISDDVVWSSLGAYETSILKKDGTLLHCGCGFSIGHARPYVRNPMNLGITRGETKIKHINYESVGINENIDVLVKINDPVFTKDVRLVLGSGEEIPMETTSNCYYNAVIPGVNKTGRLMYRITAYDSNGNSISSGEYSVEIISNDVVMIDSQNDEVIEADLKVVVNGNMLTGDVKPVIKQDRTLVPVRALSEALKAEVTWSEKTKTVTITMGSKIISFKPGEKTIKADGKTVKIDVPAVIINGRTMLPLRSISEMLGAKVNWDEKEKKLEITTSS